MTVSVVAAVFQQEDRFLLCQRPEGKQRAGQWEFPGGKIEFGESPEAALVRECREELGAEIRVLSPLLEQTQPYPDITVQLRFFQAEFLGAPAALEHAALRWASLEEADVLPLCAADREAVRVLAAAQSLRQRLLAFRDPPYGDGTAKLIPTMDRERILGIRTPQLRNLARELRGTAEAADYLRLRSHDYFEENNLHMALLEQVRSYEEAMAGLWAFLPQIDNWATCDQFCPKVFRKHLPEVLEQVRLMLRSSHPYTVRYGTGLLMRFYLEECFTPEILELAGGVRSEHYYVKMMTAWFFATALAKQWDAALPWITEKRLPDWERKKAIQKALESFRITPEQKAFLRALRQKEKPAAAKTSKQKEQP